MLAAYAGIMALHYMKNGVLIMDDLIKYTAITITVIIYLAIWYVGMIIF